MEMVTEDNTGRRGADNIPNSCIQNESTDACKHNNEFAEGLSVKRSSETGTLISSHFSPTGQSKKDGCIGKSAGRCIVKYADGIGMDVTIQNEHDNSLLSSSNSVAEAYNQSGSSEALVGQTIAVGDCVNNNKVLDNSYLVAEDICDAYFLEEHVPHETFEGTHSISEQDHSIKKGFVKSLAASADCFMPSSQGSSNQRYSECMKYSQTRAEMVLAHSHVQRTSGFENSLQDLVCKRDEHALPEVEVVSHQHVQSTQAGHPGLSNFRKSSRGFFFYELPLPEETGSWIPVSVPPMDAEAFEKILYEEGVYGGGYFPEFGAWPEGCDQESKDVEFRTTLYRVLETFFGKGKAMVETIELVWNPPQARIKNFNKSGLISKHPMHVKEFNSLCSPSFTCNIGQDVQIRKEVLGSEPPEWIPDSAASSCMLCGSTFRPFTCTRHHCRFCGGIFCNDCSTGRCLLPFRFRERDPQRVCDTCWLRLEPTQRILTDQVSNAAQKATHDVTDFSCMRAWMNNPLGMSMEQEIFKATNTLRSYNKMGILAPEKSIPKAVLKGAKGLAIITVAKIGMMMTYKIGTGLVVARRIDDTWSAPSAIASCGVGWGLQAGGELTDFIIVLRTTEAVRAFAGCVHVSVGASLSAAAGPVGRAAEADIRAGDGGSAACYSYSRSKGVFIGCSLESNVVATRSTTNTRFYGDSCVSTADILLGSLPRPKAASPLYSALSDLFSKSNQFPLIVLQKRNSHIN